MKKFINLSEFTQYLFDNLVKKAAIILKAIDAESPRLSEIAQKMPGKPEANYKELQRFLAKAKGCFEASFSGRCSLGHRRRNPNTPPWGQENSVCWHLERWQNWY